MLIHAQAHVISSSTSRSVSPKHGKEYPTLYSLLLGSQSEAGYLFFSLSKSKKELSEVPAPAPCSICNKFAQFIAAEPQTVQTWAIARLSLLLQTVHHGLGGLFCTEWKNIWWLLYRGTHCTFFITLLHLWSLFIISSSSLQIWVITNC